MARRLNKLAKIHKSELRAGNNPLEKKRKNKAT